MPRPKGSRNRVTRYGANETPKKCRYCGARGSTVRKKKDLKFAERIHTQRKRECHACNKLWTSSEVITKADHPELFSDG